MYNNKKEGNKAERETSSILAEIGFWVHRFVPSPDGQPADLIAVKEGNAYLIDSKDCKHNKFDLTRIEDNQITSMIKWKMCGNGTGWFSLKLYFEEPVYYIMSLDKIREVLDKMEAGEKKRVMSFSESVILENAYPLEEWVKNPGRYLY